MFHLHGEAPPPPTEEERLTRVETLDPGKVQVRSVVDSAPLTDDFCDEYFWDSTTGTYARYFLPRRYSQYGEGIREYLLKVEEGCRNFIIPRWGENPPDGLGMYLDIAYQYQQASVVLEKFAAVQPDAVQRVGVLEVPEGEFPPFAYPKGQRQLMMKPGGRFWIDTALDFGETLPPLMRNVPLRMARSYSFKLSLNGDSANLGIACLLANDRAQDAHSFDGDSQTRDTNGALLPLLDPNAFPFEQLEDVEYLVSIVNRQFDGARQSMHEFLEFVVNDDLRTVNVQMLLQIPGTRLADQDLVRYLQAVREFELWVRSRR